MKMNTTRQLPGLRAICLASASFAVLGLPAIAQEDTTPPPPVIAEQSAQNSSAAIFQSGPENAAKIEQSGSYMHANVLVNGARNNGSGLDEDENTIKQTGAGSEASVRVFGDDNSFDIRQSGGEGRSLANNRADVMIIGNNSSTTLSQENMLGDTFSNFADISQIGSGNIATVIQNTSTDVLSAEAIISGQNSVILEQDGLNHTATITQTGADNLVSLTQKGESHEASITQTGAGLSAIVTQTGVGDAYSLTQTGCVVGTCQVIVNRYGGGGR